MRAVVVDAPGGPEVLDLREVPIPSASAEEVLIRVRAFGLNRSELHFRQGLGSFGSFPRILGLEAVGEVVAAPSSVVPVGSKVAALMGGMGRTIDGGYAEFVAVPAEIVVPFESDLPWDVLGAIPEMLQTAYGSLVTGLRAQDGQSLLVRGGTSSVGMALAVLGKMRGMTVLSTTRSAGRRGLLEGLGVDHVLVDNGEVAGQVRELFPDGVDGAVELVGVNVMRDTLHAVRAGGTVCFTGMLSDQWTIKEFYPMDWLPNGVRLTAYSGGAADLPPAVLQGFLDAVASGEATVPIGHRYRLSDIVQAHRDLEANVIGGKAVVVT